MIDILGKIAFLITPNKEEFLELGGLNYFKLFKTNFLVKSSSIEKTVVIDELFVYAKEYKIIKLSSKKLNLQNNIRGTGCALASLICGFLFDGKALEPAVEKAKKHLFQAMKASKVYKNIGVLQYDKKD